MSKKIYNVKDSVSGSWLNYTASAHSDGEFIRSVLLQIIKSYPLKDVQAFCIGDYDENSYIKPFVIPVLVPWSVYQFPETPSQNLAQGGLSVSELDSKFDDLNNYKED